MDMQILKDLFSYYGEAAQILGIDQEYALEVLKARKRLVPSQIGKDGTLQEWADDLAQLEDKHRHFSHLYGLYPGNVMSVKSTPELVAPIKAVLKQRGDGGTGFSRAWKMALWARLNDGNRANSIYKGYLKEQCYLSMFAKCFTPLQVDGSLGLTAAISEMLVQSHEGYINLLPAVPDEWNEGSLDGVRARGGFELAIKWKDKTITQVNILSTAGKICRINAGVNMAITSNGRKISYKSLENGTIEFETEIGSLYQLSKI